MGLDHVRSEIEHLRAQVGKQRKEILQLQRAGISTASAELLLGRMHAKIDDLCAQRERLKAEQGGSTKGRALGGRVGGARPGHSRRLLLSTRPGDHRCDRSVR